MSISKAVEPPDIATGPGTEAAGEIRALIMMLHYAEGECGKHSPAAAAFVALAKAELQRSDGTMG